MPPHMNPKTPPGVSKTTYNVFTILIMAFLTSLMRSHLSSSLWRCRRNRQEETSFRWASGFRFRLLSSCRSFVVAVEKRRKVRRTKTKIGKVAEGNDEGQTNGFLPRNGRKRPKNKWNWVTMRSTSQKGRPLSKSTTQSKGEGCSCAIPSFNAWFNQDTGLVELRFGWVEDSRNSSSLYRLFVETDEMCFCVTLCTVIV